MEPENSLPSSQKPVVTRLRSEPDELSPRLHIVSLRSMSVTFLIKIKYFTLSYLTGRYSRVRVMYRLLTLFFLHRQDYITGTGTEIVYKKKY
jgi:hypothetical protein